MEQLGTTPDRDPQGSRRRPKVVGALLTALLAASAVAAVVVARSSDRAQSPDQALPAEPLTMPDLTAAHPVAVARLSGQTPAAEVPEFAATGFVYERGRFTSIAVPGASGAVPAGPARLSGTAVGGTNDRGQLVGSYVRGGASHGFLWDDGDYTTIDVPGAASTSLVDINNRGQILGSYTDRQGRTHGFIRAQDRRGDRGDRGRHGNRGHRPRITTLDVPDAAITAPHRINDRGKVAGNYTAPDEVGLPVRNGHGFVWDDGEYTTFDVPVEGPLTDPQGINDRGEIVGAYDDADGVTHGFLRTRHGRFRTIDIPGAGPLTSVLSIDERGTTVGQYADSAAAVGHGFILRNGRVTTIDVPGAPLTAASDINGRGTVVGFSYRPVSPT